jgi:hypothetical protein
VIDIGRCHQITDQSLQVLSILCRRITILGLSDCSISDLGIQYLSQESKWLETLYLFNCDKINAKVSSREERRKKVGKTSVKEGKKEDREVEDRRKEKEAGKHRGTELFFFFLFSCDILQLLHSSSSFSEHRQVIGEFSKALSAVFRRLYRHLV